MGSGVAGGTPWGWAWMLAHGWGPWSVGCPLLSFSACFPPQRRSGCLVGWFWAGGCVRGEWRSVFLTGDRLRRKRLHAHETKQKGVPRSRGKRKFLLSPQICQLYLGLLHPKYYQLHQQNHNAKFHSLLSTNSATKNVITVSNPPSHSPTPLPAPKFLSHHCKTESLCCWETLSQLWDQVQQQCSCSHTMLSLNH